MSEVYTDQRYHEYQGPSRTVRHPRACTVGGGAFATSEDGSRCVVAGKDGSCSSIVLTLVDVYPMYC